MDSLAFKNHCSSITGHNISGIENWDVSQVLDDMSSLFTGKDGCNPDFDKWNVSSEKDFVSDVDNGIFLFHIHHIDLLMLR